MTTSYYPYIGAGKIYARNTAVAGSGLIEVGNASTLTLGADEDKKELRDYTKGGGGAYASVSRVNSVTASMKLHDLNKDNIARAVFGTTAAQAAGTVTDEAVTAYKGALVPLAHPNPTSVTVTNSAATTTYVANTDYEVRPGGIFILDAGAITDAQALKVDYSYGAYNQVEALTSAAIILELRFEGLNEAQSGKPVIVDVYRLQLSPAKALDLLGDDFAELELEGTVLKDTTKTGAGVSQYFRAQLCA